MQNDTLLHPKKQRSPSETAPTNQQMLTTQLIVNDNKLNICFFVLLQNASSCCILPERTAAADGERRLEILFHSSTLSWCFGFMFCMLLMDEWVVLYNAQWMEFVLDWPK